MLTLDDIRLVDELLSTMQRHIGRVNEHDDLPDGIRPLVQYLYLARVECTKIVAEGRLPDA